MRLLQWLEHRWRIGMRSPKATSPSPLRSKPSHDGDATGRDRTHRDQHKKALDIEATRTTGGRQLIEVIKTTTVNRDPKEVYRFWRNFENNTGDEDQAILSDTNSWAEWWRREAGGLTPVSAQKSGTCAAIYGKRRQAPPFPACIADLQRFRRGQTHFCISGLVSKSLGPVSHVSR